MRHNPGKHTNCVRHTVSPRWMLLTQTRGYLASTYKMSNDKEFMLQIPALSLMGHLLESAHNYKGIAIITRVGPLPFPIIQLSNSGWSLNNGPTHTHS